MTNEVYDLVIVGGGPAGLYSSFACGMRGIRAKMLEARDSLGGRMTAYQDKLVWDLGGSQGKLASDIANNLLAANQEFEPDISYNQQVKRIKKEATGFSLTSQDGQEYKAKTVILASSLGIIRAKKLAIPADYENLSYPVEEVLNFRDYQDKTVLLYGDPEYLINYANLLGQLAKSLILVSKKEEFPKDVDFSANVTLVKNAEIASFSDEAGLITSVSLSDGQSFPVSNVLVNIGMKREANTIDFANFELETVDHHGHEFIKNEADTSTSVEGLFVVGDLGNYPDKNYMLASCMLEGTNAASKVARYLDASAKPQITVSTHNELFKAKNQEKIAKYFS
ncbi:NAD(P)/FAD-dependent oxidoreductase [Streptococcaceae bacterium ESL0729]|nr:NAD(P)/FAD-dependent oxidoreductase [Streptococcaceae bacterium ESL0729]